MKTFKRLSLVLSLSLCISSISTVTQASEMVDYEHYIVESQVRAASFVLSQPVNLSLSNHLPNTMVTVRPTLPFGLPKTMTPDDYYHSEEYWNQGVMFKIPDPASDIYLQGSGNVRITKDKRVLYQYSAKPTYDVPFNFEFSEIAGLVLDGNMKFLLTTSGDVYALPGVGLRNSGLNNNTNGTLNSVQKVGIPEKIAKLVPGYFAVYAITLNGDVYAWGDGDKGIFGDGNTSSHEYLVPKKIDGLSSIVDISYGSNAMVYALDVNGNVYAAGGNSSLPFSLVDNSSDYNFIKLYGNYTKASDGKFYELSRYSISEVNFNTANFIGTPSMYAFDRSFDKLLCITDNGIAYTLKGDIFNMFSDIKTDQDMDFLLNTYGGSYGNSGNISQAHIDYLTGEITISPITDTSLPKTTYELSKFDKMIRKLIINTDINNTSSISVTGCNNLEYVEYKDDINVVLNYAMFRDCTSLKGIEFNNTVTTITSNCFENCTSLKEIDIPENITEISSKAFLNCTSLNTINNYAKTNQTVASDAFSTHTGNKKAYGYETNTNFKSAATSAGYAWEGEPREEDNENPTITTHTLSEPNANGEVTVSLTAKDNISDVADLQYRLGEDGSWVASNAFTVTENGKINFYVKDEAENISDAYEVEVTGVIDKKKPVISSVDKAYITETDSVKLTVNATDNVGVKEYSIDGESWQESNIFEVRKNKTFSATAKDAAGNISDATSVSVTEIVDPIDEEKPVISSVTQTYNEATNTVTLTANATDNKAVTGYSFDGGTTWGTQNTTEVSENKDYKVLAKDEAGNISETSTITVSDIKPMANPTVTSTTEKTYNNDGDVTFDNFNLGEGIKAATGITSVFIGKEKTTIPEDKWGYDSTYKELVIDSSYLDTLELSGSGYPISIIMNDPDTTELYLGKLKVTSTSSSSDLNEAPSVESIGNFIFDKAEQSSIVIEGICMGYGSDKATCITSVYINDPSNNIPTDEWSFDSSFKELTINKDYLATLDNTSTPSKIYCVFDDRNTTVVPAGKITIKDTTINGTKPSVTQSNIIFDGNDVKYELCYGTDDYNCDGLSKVTVNGTEVSQSYYNVSGETLTIKEDYLDALTSGAYTVGVVFNDKLNTSIMDKLSFVIPKVAQDTTWVTESNSVINIIWKKGSTSDLHIPVSLSSDIDTITVDTLLIEDFVYNASENILAIPSSQLNTLDYGTHSIVIKIKSADMPDPAAVSFAGGDSSLGIVATVVSVGSSGMVYDKASNGTIIIKGTTDSNPTDPVEIPDTIGDSQVTVSPGAFPTGSEVTGGKVAEDYAKDNGCIFITTTGGTGTGGTGTGGTGNTSNTSGTNNTTTSNIITIIQKPDYDDTLHSELDRLRDQIKDYQNKQSSLEKEMSSLKVTIENNVKTSIPYLLPVGKLTDDIIIEEGINEIKVGSKSLGYVYGIKLEKASSEILADVDNSHWGYFNIYTSTQNGWLFTINDNVFMPNQSITYRDAVLAITRAVCSKRLNNVLSRDKVNAIYKDSGLNYSNTDENYYYAMYLISAFGKQAVPIVKKLDDTRFISREGIANMLYDLLQNKVNVDTGTYHFKDIDLYTEVGQSARFVVGAGLMKGDKGQFNKDKLLTRAEFAIILCNLYFKL